MLDTLLLFVGAPLLIVVVISLMVMAPSLTKGARFSPGQPWDAKPEWFGAPEVVAVEATPQRPALEGSASSSSVEPTGSTRTPGVAAGGDADTGGASVRW